MQRVVRRKPEKVTENDATEESGGKYRNIQVIERMMSLVDQLADSADPMSLKQLSGQTGLHPSTAHRILAAMAKSRWVERCGVGSYRLGIRLLELGHLVKTRINLREIALPFMRELHAELGEAINLGVRREDHLVYIERTSGGRSKVRVVYLVGDSAPLHLTSMGKLFLADDGTEATRQYAKRTGLPGKTEHSLTTVQALEKDLDWVRRHKIALDNEEAELGLRCTAAPIRDEEGTLIAAISVSAPVERHNPAWAEKVARTAAAISRELGYDPSVPATAHANAIKR